MARRFLGSYKNPYLNDVEVSGEASYQLDVLLDEARTRRAGTMKAKKGAFDLQRERLLSERPEGMKPDSARFDIDVEEDLNGGRLTPEMLEKMSYSPSYRPSGKVGEQISDLTISRLRYSALAGRKARAPKDLSFLADPEAREKFEEKESEKKKERDGKLRRNTVRNEVPVEQRRAQLIEMLPKEQQEKYEDIAKEINEHREKRDIAQGKIIEDKKKKKRFDDEDYSMLIDAMDMDDPTDDFRRRELDDRQRDEKIPEQYGLIDSERPMPQLYSETRHWSRIDSENPTWSEIQQNTETMVYGPKKEGTSVNPGRYIPDERFDPENRYKQQLGIEPRRMPKLESYDDMKAISINPYTADCVLSPEQIEKIMDDDFRSPGQLSLPEEVRDPKLRSVWYSTYGAKYREEEEREEREMLMAQQAQEQAQQSRRRTPSPGRRRNAQNRVPISERASAYRVPVAQGYAMGQAEADRIRQEEERRQKIIEENERRLAEEKKKKEIEDRRREDALRWAKEQEEYRRRMSGQMPTDPRTAAPHVPPSDGQDYTRRWEMQQQAAQAWQSQQMQYAQSRQGMPENGQMPNTKRWDMQQAAQAWQSQQAQYAQSRQGQPPMPPVGQMPPVGRGDTRQEGNPRRKHSQPHLKYNAPPRGKR